MTESSTTSGKIVVPREVEVIVGRKVGGAVVTVKKPPVPDCRDISAFSPILVRARVFPLATVLLAFALRLHHLTYQSFWRDEIDAVFFAGRSLPELGRMYLSVGENGPLYFTLLHFWLPVVGGSDFAVRYSSLLAGVLTVPLLYVLGTDLFGRSVGAVAALLLACAPYHIWYSQEAKMYALVAFTSTLSVHLLVRALKANTWIPWIAWLGVLTAGLYLHFFAALLIVFESVAVIIAWQVGVPGARRGGLVIMFLVIPYLPLAVWEVPLLLRGIPTSYTFLAPDAIGSILLAKFSFGLQEPTPASLVLFTFLLLGGVLLSGSGGRSKGLTLTIGWIVLPITLFYVVSLRIPLFLDRYLIIILPAYILLLGRGLVAVARRTTVVTAVVVVGITATWINAVWNEPLLKQDFKRSAAYLAPRLTTGDTLLFLPSWEHTYFDYYEASPYHWLDVGGPDEVGMESAIRPVKAVLSNSDGTLWLVSVEPEYGDQRHRLQRWLDANARLVADVPFANLTLRGYRSADFGR